jgi:DNA-nicking Smr family endonuclease
MDEIVEIPITDSIDLHTFRPGEVSEVLTEYFLACRQKGILEVRVIHGKGTGRLKAGVEAFLDKSPDVVSFGPADPRSGGWGATLVTLYPMEGDS